MARIKRPNQKKRKVFEPRNPNERAGIDPSKIGMTSEAQRTPTKQEIADFQRTGRSTAQQERIRATNRANPTTAGGIKQAEVDARNKRRGFPSGDVPTREPAPTLEERTPPAFPVEPEALVQGPEPAPPAFPEEEPLAVDPLAEQPLGQVDILNAQVGELNPEIQSQIARNIMLGVAPLPSVNLPDVAWNLLKISNRNKIRGAIEYGKKLLTNAPEMFSKETSKAAAGFDLNTKAGLNAWRLSKGLPKGPSWNTKTVRLMQTGLKKLLGNKRYGLLALAVVGATYGVVERATFLAGQTEDDIVDTINGIVFAQSEALRNDDFVEARLLTELGKEVQRDIDEADSFLDQFNMWKAGDRQMRSNLQIIASKERQIETQEKRVQEKLIAQQEEDAKFDRLREEREERDTMFAERTGKPSFSERGPPTEEELRKRNIEAARLAEEKR